MIVPFYIAKHSMTFQNTAVFTFNVAEMKCMGTLCSTFESKLVHNLHFWSFLQSCKKHLSPHLSVCLYELSSLWTDVCKIDIGDLNFWKPQIWLKYGKNIRNYMKTQVLTKKFSESKQLWLVVVHELWLCEKYMDHCHIFPINKRRKHGLSLVINRDTKL